MIIVLKHGSTAEDAKKITQSIEQAGLTPLFLPGEEKIVIGAIGDERKIANLGLDSLDIVERVVPIQKQYKLCSREYKPDSSVVSVAGVEIGGDEIIHLAGPCSVESEKQIIEIALAVKEAGAKILRGGAFKPRTSPYAFQGLEEKGLDLLQKAKAESGLPIVTEIVSEHHLDLVGEKTDMFQIGARNAQNFRLLKAVGGTKIPVLLKRGPASSLAEFLMAAEYIMSEGNPNVVLCERGIKSFHTDTRNTFDLSIIPLLKRESHLPVIADPSHGTGVRELITPMSLAAVAAGADGLIIEVHTEPEKALSDGHQQLTPDKYLDLTKRVKTISKALERS